MVNRDEFAELFYGTILNNETSEHIFFERMNKIRNWILSNVPLKLYRFRKYNKNSVDALRKDEIWGSSIREFNDPYECVPFYDLEVIRNDINNVLQPQNVFSQLKSIKNGDIPALLRGKCPSQVLEQIIHSIPDEINEYDVNEKLGGFKNHLEEVFSSEINNFIQKFYMDIQEAEALLQIACFSERNDSTLMWGHYADSHRGFCLEYNFQSILGECDYKCKNFKACNNFMMNPSIAPVVYNNVRFDATTYLSTIIQNFLCKANRIPIELYCNDTLVISKCLLTKSIEWSYENEWRLFSRPYQEQYKPYRRILCLKPTAIYMGVRMDIEKELELYSICQEKDIKCYKMLQDFHGQHFTVHAVPYEQIRAWRQ